MIRFKLEDTENEKEYSIELDFKDFEDFDDWADDNPIYDEFMYEMETGHNEWNGVHDGSGGTDDDGIEYISFNSYEIKDFETAIKMWEDFFRKNNLLK